MRMTGRGELLLTDERGNRLMRLEFLTPHPRLTIEHGIDRNVAVQALEAYFHRVVRGIRTEAPVR